MEPPSATTNPSYYHQFYPSPFHNPNPNPNPNPIDNPQLTPWPTPSASASAPPVASSDYPNYYYPPNNPDHLPNPTYSNPNPQYYPYDQSHPSYYSYDQNPPPPPQSYSGPGQSYSGSAQSYSGTGHNKFSAPPAPYEEESGKYDSWGGYSAEEHQQSGYGGGDDGVYRYEGGKVEPYGARGTAGFSKSSSSSQHVMFDDYGRPINLSNGNGGGSGDGVGQRGVKANKVVKAVPKVDVEEDVKAGVHKFRVKLLAEGYGQTEQDVLCQIGLDGIRMLDPATNRTLRIYPLETLTRWEVLDSYIFAFWAKMPVDVEPKRIRLKSNSYTTNTILDIVTAASVQLKEIGERKDPNTSKATEVQGDKKKGFDWINLIKPPNEEKDHWVPDEAVNQCTSCGTNFNAFVRKHHCRNCGEIFCDKCTQGRTPLTAEEQAPSVRVCDRCMAEVTQRLANAREAANRSGSLLSHEDLAKKLKEELNRNSKTSTGSKSEGSDVRMREVACPTCTVHLQVQVPTSGSETIECSVCQHPFLVSA